jgi:hypothetical protein
MSENQESIYIGSAKEIETQKSRFLAIELDLTVLRSKMIEIEQYIRKVKFKDGEHQLLKLVAYPLKEENKTQYKTHSLKVDTFVPRKREEYSQEPKFKQEEETQENDIDGDIPF